MPAHSTAAPKLQQLGHEHTLPSYCCAQGLKAELRTLALQEGWDPQYLPTAQQLRDVDRSDLLRVRLFAALRLVPAGNVSAWHAAAVYLCHGACLYQPMSTSVGSRHALAAAALKSCYDAAAVQHMSSMVGCGARHNATCGMVGWGSAHVSANELYMQAHDLTVFWL